MSEMACGAFVPCELERQKKSKRICNRGSGVTPNPNPSMLRNGSLDAIVNDLFISVVRICCPLLSESTSRTGMMLKLFSLVYQKHLNR